MSIICINGFKIRQVEVVKQYSFISFRSHYKEYLIFDFKPFHCTLHYIVKIRRPKTAFQVKNDKGVSTFYVFTAH